MPIKKTPILSKDDFEEAIVSLRLSISELARETGIPRQYLSHFRTYGDGLKPEQVAKVRDYLESRLAENGMSLEEADDEPDHSDPAEAYVIRPGEIPLSDLDSREDLTRALLCVRHFALSPALTCEQITAALERMDENDDAILALMETEAVTGFLSDWDTDTTTRMQEAFGLIAQNYLLFRHLQGRAILPIGGLKDEEVKTIGDVVAGLMAASLGELSDRVSTKPAKVHEPAGDGDDRGDEE